MSYTLAVVAVWLTVAVVRQVMKPRVELPMRCEHMSTAPDPTADRHEAYPAKSLGAAEVPSGIAWAEPPHGRRPIEGSCPSCGATERRYCAMDCQLIDPCNPF